jgi:hypothetical protein
VVEHGVKRNALLPSGTLKVRRIGKAFDITEAEVGDG